jgi:hypothetical protein
LHRASIGLVKQAQAAAFFEPEIDHFVMAITAKATHTGYTKGAESTTEKERPMIKIVLSVLAALAVTVGALTITGAGDDRSSTPTMTTLPVQY